MIFLKIILVLASAVALYWQIRMKKLFPTVITAGMVAAIIMALILPQTLRTIAFIAYMGFVALVFLYGLTAKEKGVAARLVLMLMSVGIFTYWLWILNHWHGNELLAPALTLIAGCAGLAVRAQLKNELGFMLLMATDALLILLEHFLKSA